MPLLSASDIAVDITGRHRDDLGQLGAGQLVAGTGRAIDGDAVGAPLVRDRSQSIGIRQRVGCRQRLAQVDSIGRDCGGIGGGGHAINDEGLVGPQRVGRARRSQSQYGAVAGGVLDGAATEDQGAAAYIVQIGAGVTGLNGVIEGEGAGSRAAVVIKMVRSVAPVSSVSWGVPVTLTASLKATVTAMTSPTL